MSSTDRGRPDRGVLRVIRHLSQPERKVLRSLPAMFSKATFTDLEMSFSTVTVRGASGPQVPPPPGGSLTPMQTRRRNAKRRKKKRPRKGTYFFLPYSGTLLCWWLNQGPNQFQRSERRLLWILDVETTDSVEKEGGNNVEGLEQVSEGDSGTSFSSIVHIHSSSLTQENIQVVPAGAKQFQPRGIE